MKSKLVFLVAFIALLFASCSFNPDNSEPEESENLTVTIPDEPPSDLPDNEILDFNPSIDELKETNIPIVEINVSDGSDIDSKEIWKTASISITGDFCGEENLIIEEFQIKGRGNSSWSLPKKPYSMKFSSKEKVLGMAKSKRWVLIANYSDKTLLRNYFISKLGNNLYNTVWNPSFKSVNLVVNGKYQGVYLLGESIRIDKNRVNIDDISEKEDGGFIFEINARLDEKFNFVTENNVCISLKDPDDANAEIQETVKNVIQNAETVLFSDDYTDSETGYCKYFDVDSVIDWYIMNELGKNVDSANFSSIYFYYDGSDRLLHMGPNWDFDISCGNVNYNGCDSYTGLYVKENSIWIKRMFSDTEFVEKLKERWNGTKTELQNYINSELQSYADILSDSVEVNFKKWDLLGHYVWPNCAGYENRTTYQSEVDYMINWLNCRYDYMDEAINAL